MNDPTSPRAQGSSVPAEARGRPSADSRVNGPGPGTRAYLVLDTQKMSIPEMSAAIMAMVRASRNAKS